MADRDQKFKKYYAKGSLRVFFELITFSSYVVNFWLYKVTQTATKDLMADRDQKWKFYYANGSLQVFFEFIHA